MYINTHIRTYIHTYRNIRRSSQYRRSCKVFFCASWLVSSLRLLTVAMETTQCVIIAPLTDSTKGNS